MKYSIMICLSTETLQYSKILSLKSMFDPSSSNSVQMISITPSFDFTIKTTRVAKKEFAQALRERLEEQWYGHEKDALVSLKSIDFISNKRRHELNLNMDLNDDFYYAKEALLEELLEGDVFFHNEKKIFKNFSPHLNIAHFQTEEQLSNALEYLKTEIQLPIYLKAFKMALYQKRADGQSFLIEDLFYFHSDKR